MILSPHSGCLHKLPLGHHAHGPIYDFGSNHNWDYLRIGHGWYDQQHYILIVVLDPWHVEVDLHKPKVWMAEPTVPSSSHN